MKVYERPEAEKILLTALETITDGAGEGVDGNASVPHKPRPGQ